MLTHRADPHVVGRLELPTLITCLEERIAVMKAGGSVEIGCFPELLEETVRFCKSVRDGAPSSLADDLHSRLRV